MCVQGSIFKAQVVKNLPIPTTWSKQVPRHSNVFSPPPSHPQYWGYHLLLMLHFLASKALARGKVVSPHVATSAKTNTSCFSLLAWGLTFVYLFCVCMLCFLAIWDWALSWVAYMCLQGAVASLRWSWWWWWFGDFSGYHLPLSTIKFNLQRLLLSPTKFKSHSLPLLFINLAPCSSFSNNLAHHAHPHSTILHIRWLAMST